MLPAVQTSLLCQLAGGESGGGIFVLKAGDTMTGPLNISPVAALVASDPALDLIQTWNNAGVTFAAFRINITNTAAGSASTLIDGLVDAISRFQVRKNSTTILHRQEADNSAATLQLSKRGATGDSTGPVATGAVVSALDTAGWNGTTQGTVAFMRVIATETFGAGVGTRIDFAVAAIGSTTLLNRLSLSSNAINIQNGAALQLNGSAYFNPLTVYAAGTSYTLTATSAPVVFGTTSPAITINSAGTYAIRAQVRVALNAATFAANRVLTVKLSRTNNTPADITNSGTPWLVPIMTTLTQTLAVIQLPEVIYTTANADDAIQIFADISVLPSAGSVTINQASIVAVRISA